MDPRQDPQAQAAIIVPESAEGVRMLPNGSRRSRRDRGERIFIVCRFYETNAIAVISPPERSSKFSEAVQAP